MKKVILTHWAFVLIEYTVIYLIKTFIIWEFKNPFEWIINLPSYDPGDRFLILFYFVAWQVIQYVIIYKHYFPKTKKETEQK